MAGLLIIATLLLVLVAPSQSTNSESASGCTNSADSKTLTCTNITELPKYIDGNVTKLEIIDSTLERIENIVLPKHITKLRIRNCQIKTIGKFNSANKHLKELYISHNQPVKLNIESGAFDNLASLIHLGLDDNLINSFPVFNDFSQKLKILSLRGNNIKELKPEHLIKFPELEELHLRNNKITSLQNGVFPVKNKIKILEMSNNPIKSIASHAFENLVSLKTLYLDGIDIENLPTVGLQNLITLSLDRVHRLRTIPEGLEKIENVKLAEEKSFLCCKLKFDRIRPRLTGPHTTLNRTTRRTTRSKPTTPTNRATRSEPTTPAGFGKRKKRRSILTLPPSASPSGSINTVPPPRRLNCTPEPTAFQPCEDVMGADWLTAVSFIIAPFALCGNFVVLVVFLCLARNYNVSRFLVTNLALADLSMGVYLLSLVIESVITSGEYYKHVERFQFGLSCNVLGFLAMFSSELSVFSLTMITVERYLTIVYAMYPRYRLTMRTAIICMIIGWIVAITVAVLPITGVGSYGKVAICLPFDTDNGGDLYLFFVFGLNGVGFLFVCALYAQIYRSVFRTNNSTPTRGHDSRVARRMALLVFTDFACFTPIAITGISALLGNPLIDVKQSKYLLVFFFPLNGLLNPFLYAIITKTFRRDLAALLKNCFVCGGNLTNYISNFPGSRSVQSTNDVLNPSARPSLDFNAMGGFHSLGNIRGSRENPVSASFSKSEPNLVKFSDEALHS